MIIRRVRAGDFKQIGDIYRHTYQEVRNDPNFGDYVRIRKPTRDAERRWEKSIWQDVKQGHFVYMVAEDEGKIRGFCYVVKKDIPDSEMSHVGCLGIRVADGFRGNGIGSRLLTSTLASCRGKFDTVEANVISGNKVALRMYSSFGFRKWGTAPGYVKRNRRYMDMVYMYLKLR